MKILFTFEDAVSLERAFYLINWCSYKGHSITVHYQGKVFGYMNERCNTPITSISPDFNSFDYWVYSVKGDIDWQKKSSVDSELKKFNGKLYMLNMEDGMDFFSHKISVEVLDKTLLYIGNVWNKNKDEYVLYNNTPEQNQMTSAYSDKFRLIPSFHESSNFIELRRVPVIPFKEKLNTILFIGSMTGDVPVQDARYHSIRKMVRTHSIQVDIDVIGYCPDIINTHYYNRLPSFMKKERKPFEDYIRRINNSKFSLCPKGNSPHITYRFYEALRYKTLIFINEVASDIEYYNPPSNNPYCVWYKSDCSDLLELITYYSQHMEKAEQIVENGYNYWKQNFEFDYKGWVVDALDKHLSDTLDL